MTRTLSISATICGECYTSYDTVEEAYECEYLDAAEAAAYAEWEQAEAEAEAEQTYWEASNDYLASTYAHP